MFYSPVVPPLNNASVKTAASKTYSLGTSSALAVGLGALMVAIVGGSVATHTSTFAFAFIPIFIFAIVIYAMRDTTIALSIYFTYTALEGMFKYMSNFSQAVYVVKPLLVGIILAGLFLSNRMNGMRLRKLPLAAIISLFIAWGLLEAFHPLGVGVSSGILTALIWYIIPIGFYVIGFNVFQSSKRIVSMLLVIMAVCTVVSAFGFLQYNMGREWTVAHVPGYSNLRMNTWNGADSSGTHIAQFRPASTSADEGFTQFWAQLGALIALAMMLLNNASLRCRIILAICFIVNVCGLLTGGSRMMLVVGVMQLPLLFGLTSTSPRALLRNLGLAAVVVGITWVAFSSVQSISHGSIASRYGETLANPLAKFGSDRGGFQGQGSWFLDFLGQHPLGIGYQRGTEGSWDATTKNISVNRETQFAAISGDMGAPGLLLLLGIVAGITIGGIRAVRALKNPEFRIIGAMLLLALMGYFIAFWAGQMLQAVGDYLWLFAALLFTLPRLERRMSSETVNSKPAVKVAGGDIPKKEAG